MTHAEPERLSVQIQELMERRAKLRGTLEHALHDSLSRREREDILRVIAFIDVEVASLKRRLDSFPPSPDAGAGVAGMAAPKLPANQR